MRTHNEIVARAPLEPCLEAARDVERWPEILPHYRDVHFVRKDGPGRGRVSMSAFRHFGPLPYPVWWESEMATDREAAEVRYHHVDGITRGMDVLWTLEQVGDRTGAGATEAGRSADRPGAATGPGGPAADGPGGSSRGEPATRIVIVHEWDGPGWPVIGGFAARRVIGPHFVHVVADRTLAGIRREVEGRAPR